MKRLIKKLFAKRKVPDTKARATMLAAAAGVRPGSDGKVRILIEDNDE